MLEGPRKMIAPYFMEFMGTFVFLSCISWMIWNQTLNTTTVVNGNYVTAGNPFVPLAIGSSLMVVVYAGGSISGGHFNPAVSLAIFLTGSTLFPSTRSHVDFGIIQLIGYWIAQLCGSFLAGCVSFGFQYNWFVTADGSFYNSPGTPTGQGFNTYGLTADNGGILYAGYPARGNPGSDPVGWGTAMVVEMFGTMALVLVVLNVATVSTGAANAGNSTFGLAIGSVITCWAYGAGGITGGAFNPAVGCLPLVWGKTRDVGIYWCGPLMGGILGALFFMLTNPEEFMGEIGDMMKHVKDCINEFIGTMLFCLLISFAAGLGGFGGGLAIGTMLMCMVYMGGHVSGGHFNPAVSLAVWIRGKAPWWKSLLYVLCQSIGSLCAGGVAYLVYQDFAPGNGTPGSSLFGMPGFATQTYSAYTAGGGQYSTQYPFATCWFVELFGTFILCFSVLMSATCDEKNQNNGYYGLAIGFSVVISAYSFGWVSGGAFNPAVGLLPLACPNDLQLNIKNDRWKFVLCYWTGPFFGAALAAFMFWFHNPDEGYFMVPQKVQLVGESGRIDLAQGEAGSVDQADIAAEGDNEDPTAATEDIPTMGDEAVQGSI